MPRFNIKFTSHDNNGHFRPIHIQRNFRSLTKAVEWIDSKDEQGKMKVPDKVTIVNNHGEVFEYER